MLPFFISTNAQDELTVDLFFLMWRYGIVQSEQITRGG